MNVARRGAIGVGLFAAFTVMCTVPCARVYASPAEGASAAREAPRTVVRLVVAGEDADATNALESSVRELVARLMLTVEMGRAERLDLDAVGLSDQSSAELAIVWVDLRASRAMAVVVEGRTGHAVARRSVERDRSTAIIVEELAHIIQASVEELADQERRRAPAEKRPEPPKPEVPRVSTNDEDKRWGLDGGGFFGGRGFGPGAEAVVGGGGMVGAAYGRKSWRPALWLMATYHVAFDVRGGLVDIHTKAAALRLAPTLRVLGGEKWLVEAGPQAGVDILWTSPRANSANEPASRFADESVDASLMVGALVAAHVAVAPSADLVLALAADVDLTPHRFIVLQGSQSETIFDPWRVRPALLVGFTFNLAGSLPYPVPPPGEPQL